MKPIVNSRSWNYGRARKWYLYLCIEYNRHSLFQLPSNSNYLISFSCNLHQTYYFCDFSHFCDRNTIKSVIQFSERIFPILPYCHRFTILPHLAIISLDFTSFPLQSILLHFTANFCSIKVVCICIFKLDYVSWNYGNMEILIKSM